MTSSEESLRDVIRSEFACLAAGRGPCARGGHGFSVRTGPHRSKSGAQARPCSRLCCLWLSARESGHGSCDRSWLLSGAGARTPQVAMTTGPRRRLRSFSALAGTGVPSRSMLAEAEHRSRAQASPPAPARSIPASGSHLCAPGHRGPPARPTGRPRTASHGVRRG